MVGRTDAVIPFIYDESVWVYLVDFVTNATGAIIHSLTEALHPARESRFFLSTILAFLFT
jgi:hypothetical protein